MASKERATREESRWRKPSHAEVLSEPAWEGFPNTFTKAATVSDGERVCGVETASSNGERETTWVSKIRMSRPEAAIRRMRADPRKEGMGKVRSARLEGSGRMLEIQESGLANARAGPTGIAPPSDLPPPFPYPVPELPLDPYP